eukprot:5972022-Pyramimonas_sp.AAC.1
MATRTWRSSLAYGRGREVHRVDQGDCDSDGLGSPGRHRAAGDFHVGVRREQRPDEAQRLQSTDAPHGSHSCWT